MPRHNCMHNLLSSIAGVKLLLKDRSQIACKTFSSLESLFFTIGKLLILNNQNNGAP